MTISMRTTVTVALNFQTKTPLQRQQGMDRISRLGASVHSQFQAEIHSEGSACVIAVGGELDLASGPEFERVLERAAESCAELLVIDMRRLDFMDSTGLSIIVRTHQQLAQQGRSLGLVKGSAQVQRLLDLTGVAARLSLVDAPEELLRGG